VGAQLGGRGAAKFGPAIVVRAGIFVQLAGVVAAATVLRTEVGWAMVAGPLALFGLGAGMASSQLTNVILSEVSRERAGSASGVATTNNSLGAALGVTILGAVPDRDRAQLAGELLHCFLDQVLTIGTFHADPHPGNIFLTPSGQIALLDCSSIGMLDRRQRGALRSVLVAIANQDPGQLRDALRDVTMTSKSIDEQMLERASDGMTEEARRRRVKGAGSTSRRHSGASEGVSNRSPPR
jgi:ubiquinone biosynthesis protein